MNREKQRQHVRNHYYNNKRYYLAKNTKKRNEMRAWLQTIKERGCCTDCKQKFPYFVFDFDHRDDVDAKTIEVSRLVCLLSWDKLYEEIAKCELVCANCHRLRTHARRGAKVVQKEKGSFEPV